MEYEIWCNGKLHYTRPEGHPDIQEVLDLIEEQQRDYGMSEYSVRIARAYCDCDDTRESEFDGTCELCGLRKRKTR